MKHSTPQLLKFQRLQRRLGETKRGLVGLLELLWHGTATQAPQGDIGKFSNEEIAILVDWEGDYDQLVDALVETGWLDRCSKHRLVVHDWGQHAPNWVRMLVKKRSLCFSEASAEASTEGSVEASQEASTEASAEGTPNLTKPNLTNMTPNGVSDVSRNLEPSVVAARRYAIAGGKEVSIEQRHVDRWCDTYRDRLDVEHELAKAADWLAANAAKRPRNGTGLVKFLASWMSRADERQRRNARGSPAAEAPGKARIPTLREALGANDGR
jgi:hypothetical protein